MRAPPPAAALRAVLELKFLSRKITSKPSMIGSRLRRVVSHLSEPGHQMADKETFAKATDATANAVAAVEPSSEPAWLRVEVGSAATSRKL
jgi:hypothetical protein